MHHMHEKIQAALERVNSPYNKWDIRYCEDENSSWFEARDEANDTFFMRASLDDLIQVCHILSGRRKP
jgi:hypothetical protein